MVTTNMMSRSQPLTYYRLFADCQYLANMAEKLKDLSQHKSFENDLQFESVAAEFKSALDSIVQTSGAI